MLFEAHINQSFHRNQQHKNFQRGLAQRTPWLGNPHLWISWATQFLPMNSIPSPLLPMCPNQSTCATNTSLLLHIFRGWLIIIVYLQPLSTNKCNILGTISKMKNTLVNWFLHWFLTYCICCILSFSLTILSRIWGTGEMLWRSFLQNNSVWFGTIEVLTWNWLRGKKFAWLVLFWQVVTSCFTTTKSMRRSWLCILWKAGLVAMISFWCSWSSNMEHLAPLPRSLGQAQQGAMVKWFWWVSP